MEYLALPNVLYHQAPTSLTLFRLTKLNQELFGEMDGFFFLTPTGTTLTRKPTVPMDYMAGWLSISPPVQVRIAMRVKLQSTIMMTNFSCW
jgi:hypothetical protein